MTNLIVTMRDMDLSEPVFLLSEDDMKAKMHCEKLVSETVEQ